MEHWVSLLLSTLVKADHAGMSIVTNNLAIATQTKMIRAILSVYAHKEQKVTDAVAELLQRVDDLRTERNELVHGIWDTTNCEPKTALIQTVNLDRAEIIRTRLITVPDLDDLMIEIDKWIADYIKLGRQLGFPRRSGQTKSIFSD